jgi:GNAT superfamily N-acetyltransferase
MERRVGMEIRIRPAGMDDLPVLLAQRRGMFRDMGDPEGPAMQAMLESAEPFLRARLADGRCRAWLAESSGRIVAGGVIDLVAWIPGYADPSPVRPYLHNVYTEPEFRRRGIARMLVETILRWCRAQGYRSVTLHASEHGRGLYHSLGFADTNEMRLVL